MSPADSKRAIDTITKWVIGSPLAGSESGLDATAIGLASHAQAAPISEPSDHASKADSRRFGVSASTLAAKSRVL